MENLRIEQTNKSPEVVLSVDNSSALFKGRSIHSDSFLFYEPIIKWFSEYNNDTLDVDFIFDHINTSTNKCILQIILNLGKRADEGKDITICWHYDENDDDMLETGEELEILSNIKFEYKKI